MQQAQWQAVYLHGKGGNAREAEHYRALLPGWRVAGFDYRAQTPWDAREEFPPWFEAARRDGTKLLLIANSIGAFFAMQALDETRVDRALFISPVVDMEQLIEGMMAGAGVNEPELQQRGEIATEFGETLSWRYLQDVRQHPIQWRVPTAILYGSKDALMPRETVEAFAGSTGAALTVMEGGEHWFHTEAQMQFLDEWVRDNTADFAAEPAEKKGDGLK